MGHTHYPDPARLLSSEPERRLPTSPETSDSDSTGSDEGPSTSGRDEEHEPLLCPSDERFVLLPIK